MICATFLKLAKYCSNIISQVLLYGWERLQLLDWNQKVSPLNTQNKNELPTKNDNNEKIFTEYTTWTLSAYQRENANLKPPLKAALATHRAKVVKWGEGLRGC